MSEEIKEVEVVVMQEESKPEERNKLVVLMENSSLPETEGQKMLDVFNPFMKKMAEIENKINAINQDDPQPEDVQLARITRLALKKNRIASGNKKKEMKKDILIKGKLLDNFNNIIINTSKPLEEKCEAIENYAKNIEKARVEKLIEDRTAKLKEFDVDTEFLLVGDMNEDQFSKLYESSILNFETKARQKLKEEQDKIELEKSKAKRDERMKAMKSTGLTFNGTAFTYNEISVSWTDLACMPKEEFQATCEKLTEEVEDAKKAEAEEKEKERLEKERLQKELEEKEKEIAAQKEKEEEERKTREAKEEKERIKREKAAEKERKSQEKKLADEKKKNDLAFAKAKAKADKERKQQEEVIAKEKDKREKVEAKLKEKNRIEKEAAEKAKAEEEAKLKATDKQKIIAFVDDIEKIMIPVIKNKTLVEALDKALELISKASYILKNAE